MFERFSDRARRVVVDAQGEARDLHHDYIGTEHLLLGLARDEAGAAARALDQLSIDYQQIREQVVELVGRGDSPPKGHIPFTKHAKKILELALREALALKHNYIGTEHILLGLARDDSGKGAQILVALGAGRDQVRREVNQLLSGPAGEAGPAAETGSRPSGAHTPAALEVLAIAEELAGGSPVGSHHLLEAMARTDRSAAAHALTAVGVDVEVLAATLDQVDLAGTTDLTPEEEAARQMEIRLVEDEVQVVLRDQATVAQVREITGQLAGSVRGTDPVAGGLVIIHQAVRRYLDRLQRRLTAPATGELAEFGAGQTVPGPAQQAIWSRLRRRSR